MDTFKKFFDHILWQCKEAALVYGSQVFVAFIHIDTDGSNDSIADTRGFKKYLNKSYSHIEKRLDDFKEIFNRTLISYILTINLFRLMLKY